MSSNCDNGSCNDERGCKTDKSHELDASKEFCSSRCANEWVKDVIVSCDWCYWCDGKVEMDGDECMHCCNWNCDKMVCGKSGCSSQLAFFECCQECEAEAREQGEESDEEDPDRCVRCDRTFNQRKTIFNDGDCAFAWELHCDSGDDEGDLCATCLQKWVDEVKANGEWNRLAEL